MSPLDRAEVSAIYRSYGHLMRRRCRVVLRDEALADDALQDTLIKLLRYGGSFREAESPVRYLYRACDRACFDQFNRRRDRREVPPLPNDQRRVEAPAVQVEIRDAVTHFLSDLDTRERSVAVMAFVDGMNQGEIAGETGWSRQTINKKLKMLRQRARVALGGVA